MSTATEPGEELDEGEIHEVLRNDRRRLALEALRDSGGEESVRELSERIAAHETGEEPPPKKKRQSVYVSLHQTHLPKLDELEVVEYDPEERDVLLGDRVEEIEVYMEVVPEYGLSFGEFYLGLALLGLLTTTAVLRFAPDVSALTLGAVVVGLFVLQMVAAAYHVYTRQDRTVFERIFERA